MTLTMDIEYFIAWRNASGLTQEQLADKICVSAFRPEEMGAQGAQTAALHRLPDACVEKGIEPVGKDAMVQVDESSDGVVRRAPVEPRSRS